MAIYSFFIYEESLHGVWSYPDLIKTPQFKGIVSILFLKNFLKNVCRKNYKNHLRKNNYEVCIAVAHCFPNISDATVLENIN
jgi:hypothetical protein